MKELTIEQKAKAYDEALERAKQLPKISVAYDRFTIERIFPELKESEDERMVKFIKNQLFNIKKTITENYELDAKLTNAIDWLEKQGEQKSTIKMKNPEESLGIDSDTYNKIVDECIYDGQKTTDKVEHLNAQKGVYYVCIKNYYSADGKTTNTKGKIYKSPCDEYINDDRGFGLSWINSCTENYFRPIKEEDWIVCEQYNVIGKPLQYKEFRNNKLIQKNIKSLEDKGIVPNLRLLTIQDARDGDILSYRDGQWIFIYKEKIDDSTFSYHALYSTIHQDLTINDVAFTLLDYAIIPATKEQRDTLFAKMKEAGYEWDADKKELKYIGNKEVNGEDYGIDSLWHAQRILEKTLGSVDGYQSDDGILEHKAAITAVKKLYEQKSAWSEKYIADVFEKVGLAKIVREQSNDALTNALQSAMIELSKVMPQSSHAWSEEDEETLDYIIDYIEKQKSKDTIHTKRTEVLEGMVVWLKSLKYKYTWKPSEEQMEYLGKTVNEARKYHNSSSNGHNMYDVLNSLYEQLEQL